ncbi:MAG: T9SS type A sorting domain-containing protein, partial [Saprospiraceae bacterium]|nr:T9SS type A sorting domain-containing protein [Saprospiraceae bacterium]
FPELQEWALLRDFDGDSIVDIFSYSTTGVPGIDVYKGHKNGNTMSFSKIVFDNPVGVLGYPTASGTITNIYVSATDIPAIDDIDGDGDLDILTFQSDGTKLYYYRNMVVENGLSTDEFDYVLEDKCWGRIVESFNTNEVILSSDSLSCPSSQQTARLHSGSTVTTVDFDQDGDKDVVLGDLTYPNMLYLENGGTNKLGWIVSQTSDFPDVNERIEIAYFPAAYFVDINHDGIQDLVASPNEKDARQNVEQVWFYSGGENDNFILETKSFINDGMLDFGTEANPVFIDYNGDGLLDVLVGSRFHKDYIPEHPSQLFLYQNTGSSTLPQYELVDEDWLDLSSLIMDDVDALSPVAVDIDGDADLDLVIGNKFGKLIFVENIGIENGPFEMGTVTYPWFDIDVGFSSAPAFTDIDGDGILDMLLGEERGTINYFHNLGSTTDPFFESDPQHIENYEEFGGIDARQDNAVFGMSSPSVFHGEDTTFLIVGTNFGNMLLYDITNVSPTDILTPIADHPISAIREGARSKPRLDDIDHDGYMDLIIGSARGGVSLFHTSFRNSQMVPSRDFLSPSLVTLHPNPATSSVFIRGLNQSLARITIVDAAGRKMYEWSGSATDIEIQVSNFHPGLYYANILTKEGSTVKPWVKME